MIVLKNFFCFEINVLILPCYVIMVIKPIQKLISLFIIYFVVSKNTNNEPFEF